MRIRILATGVAIALSTQALIGTKVATAAMAIAMTPSSSPTNLRTKFPLPRPARPSGSTVLYDQSGAFDNGAPVQKFQAANAAFDTDAADDFTVTDVNGWTISGFNFEVAFQAGGEPADPPAGIVYNINVYADDNRQIGGSLLCSYPGVSGTLDGSNTYLSVALPTPCVLPTGIYWLEFQPVFDSPPQAFWLNSWTSAFVQFGNVAQWKNPNGGFGVGCTEWSPISMCGDADGNLIGAGIPNFLFQVVGSVNGNGGANCTDAGICLQLTLAPADRAIPGLCGTDTSLTADVGDQINFCYRVTNNSGVDLDFQTLSDNVDGTIFSEMDRPLAAGATWQYNRTVTLGASETVTAAWAAQDILSGGYTATLGSSDADRVFADGFDGTAAPVQSGFIDISATGTPLDLFNDVSTADVSMPFSFSFYGQTSNQLCIGNNGDIQFGISGCEGFPNFALPYFNFGAAILSYWDYLYTNGQVYYATLGEAPNRRFVVEWYQKDSGFNPSSTDTITFETILDEAGSAISFQYLDTVFGDPVHDDGATATIGLQRNNTQADQFSYDQASIGSGSKITWAPNVPATYTGTATVSITAGAPVVAVAPSSLSGTAVVGSSTSMPLTIANTGNRDLDWSLREAASNAHLPVVSAFVLPFGDPRTTSGGRAPLAGGHARTNASRSTTRISSGVPVVPSYAIESIGGELETFSAEWPRDWTTVGALGLDDNFFTAGDFFFGDFSTLYALNYDNNQLVAVDTATGSASVIGTASGLPGSSISGMKQDPVTGTVYVTTLPPDSSGVSQLWTIDPTTTQTTLVGTVTNSIAIIDIAFNAQGQMYGVDIADDALVAIDKTTAEGSVIGSLGFNANYASGLAFDLQTNTLYFATVEDFGGFNVVQEMWTIDTVTGAATLISPVSTTPGQIQIDAFAIAHQATACSAATDIPWLSYDLAGGTTTGGGSAVVTVTLNAAGLNAGTYSANLCVQSNDPVHRSVAVPVEFDVGNPTADGAIRH